MSKYFNYIKSIENKIINHYQSLHMNPEIGFDLENTYSYVFNYLLSLGLNPKNCGKCGIICDIGTNNENIILLRADMDALEIKEKTDLYYKSKNNYMHACGHDAHTAILLGVAEVLKEFTFDGTIRLMFQPAEEILAGAKEMVKYGALDKVKYAVMLHILVDTNFNDGTIILPKTNIITPSSDNFEIILTGNASHSAYVDKSKDLLFIFNIINELINNIIIKENLNENNVLFNICQIDYGTTYNTIPDTLVSKGNIRTFNNDVRKYIKYRINEIINSISKLYDINIKFIVDYETEAFLNNSEFQKNLIEIFEKNNICYYKIKETSKSWGSEDFSIISNTVPTNMILLSSGKSKEGYSNNIHNPFFKLNTNSLIYGVNALVNIALEMINKLNIK